MVGAEIGGMGVGNGLGSEFASFDLANAFSVKCLSDLQRLALTGFPFTMQGTSKGSSCCICAKAASSAFRSAEPGAYDFWMKPIRTDGLFVDLTYIPSAHCRLREL